jgi:hypothetical protein
MHFFLAVWERVIVQGQPGQKVHETLSQPMTGLGGACPSSQLCRRIPVQTDPGMKQTPISKITTQKGLPEWLKWSKLSSKHEALSSTPSSAKTLKLSNSNDNK